jgi:hypothetical protein
MVTIVSLPSLDSALDGDEIVLLVSTSGWSLWLASAIDGDELVSAGGWSVIMDCLALAGF